MILSRIKTPATAEYWLPNSWQVSCWYRNWSQSSLWRDRASRCSG